MPNCRQSRVALEASRKPAAPNPVHPINSNIERQFGHASVELRLLFVTISRTMTRAMRSTSQRVVNDFENPEI